MTLSSNDRRWRSVARCQTMFYCHFDDGFREAVEYYVVHRRMKV